MQPSIAGVSVAECQVPSEVYVRPFSAGSFRGWFTVESLNKFTYSLHYSSFLGLPYRILNIILVKPKKGTTMETIGKAHRSKSVS